MSAPIRKLAIGAGLLALTATALSAPASAQFGGREELAAGNAAILITPDGSTGGAGITPGSGGENRVGNRTFKIVRVTPLQGQNPLNQESPALNFNNETFDNATELQDAAEGNDNNNDLAGADNCSGNSINSAIENFGGTNFAFAGINLDSNTGDCVLRNDGEGPFLIYQFPGSGVGGADDNALDIFPDALVNEFTLINPPPTAGSGVNVAFGSFVFTLRAINGNEFDVTFTVTKLDGNLVGGVVVNPSFRLDVTSIVQTN